MSCSLKMSFSHKIILLSSFPSKCEGSEVVQLCAVMIRRPVSLLRFKGEAVSVSLCTLVEVSCQVVAVCLA